LSDQAFPIQSGMVLRRFRATQIHEKPGQISIVSNISEYWDLTLVLYLHQLRGKHRGRWSVRVSGNWRITFKFDGPDALDVDYEDYH